MAHVLLHTAEVISKTNYIRDGYDADTIPEKSSQRVSRAADQILKAGRSEGKENEH
jgi:hypothetical protein